MTEGWQLHRRTLYQRLFQYQYVPQLRKFFQNQYVPRHCQFGTDAACRTSSHSSPPFLPDSSLTNLTYCLSESHPDSTGHRSPCCSSLTSLDPSHALPTSDKPDCSSASLLLGSVDEDICNLYCCSCNHQSQHSRCEYHREESIRDLSSRGCLLHSSSSDPVCGSSPATSPSNDCERYPPSGIHLQGFPPDLQSQLLDHAQSIMHKCPPNHQGLILRGLQRDRRDVASLLSSNHISSALDPLI